MTLKVITLELARNPGEPLGDPQHRYVFRAPLTADGQIDRAHWSTLKQLCTVRRFEKGREIEAGLLTLTRGGQWLFSYAPGDDDDETLFRFGRHHFLPGEYLAITEHDGVQRTFTVVSVTDWHPDPALATPAAS